MVGREGAARPRGAPVTPERKMQLLLAATKRVLKMMLGLIEKIERGEEI